MGRFSAAKEHVVLMSRAAMGISGVGGIAGFYGAYQLIHGNKQSAWFWLFAGFLILFLAQIQTVQRAIKQRNDAKADAIKVDQSLIGGSATVGTAHMAGNLMVAGLQRPDNGENSRRLRISKAERADLVARGRDLADCLLEFSAERRANDPHESPMPPPKLDDEEMSKWIAEGGMREPYFEETQKLYERDFVGRIDEWVDHVTEAGVDPGFELGEGRFHHALAGPNPMGETAQRIRVLAGKAERRKSRWQLRRSPTSSV